MQVLDYAEAAELLNTTPRHVRELCYRRQVPFIKVGRLVRFIRGDLEEWLAHQRVPPARRSS